ncbi:hypothetical protein [Streptomyces sp. Ru72]|uniref:hypothetical protein n=1 Tax=Streptomyces sp. Ru72 TaxID=2080747 RepID=UPI0015E2FBEF|nr:hypothetical protein [Streptomyces sp. Ru72]
MSLGAFDEVAAFEAVSGADKGDEVGALLAHAFLAITAAIERRDQTLTDDGTSPNGSGFVHELRRQLFTVWEAPRSTVGSCSRVLGSGTDLGERSRSITGQVVSRL